MSGVAAGCEGHSLKHPSAEVLEHDFLWNAWRQLPSGPHRRLQPIVVVGAPADGNKDARLIMSQRCSTPQTLPLEYPEPEPMTARR